MIKYMVDKINQIYTVQNIESLEESELAEWLLESIEEKGMMPPEVTEKSFRILPSGEMTYAVHEWEPEDEKK